MATNLVLQKQSALTTMTCTLASLATSAVGVGRQTTLINNKVVLQYGAKVYVKVTVGTTPTINTSIYVYLLEADDATTPTISTDAAGASDAGWTAVNARLLGVISVPATTSDTAYYGVFDTGPLGPLAPAWGIGIVHDTAVNLNATGGNHLVKYVSYSPDVQASA